jgi:hypothetical protein
MPSKINASVSSGLVVDSDLTGSLQLQTGGNPAISIDSSQVVNFTKQFQIAGVLPPAFSAFQSSAQTLSGSTFTKITFTSEVFDTNNNFASSTFTPTVAGYYQINCGISVATSATVIILLISKNGSTVYKVVNTNSATVSTVSGSGLVYMNGSTDYLEVYGLFVTGQNVGTGSTETYFNGVLVRAA